MTSTGRARPGEAGRWRALRLLLVTTWRAGPGRVAGSAATTVALALSHLVTIYGMKVVVDGVTAAESTRAIVGGLLIALALAARMGASWMDGTTTTAMRERTAMALEERIVELASGIPGLEHHERAELLDQIQQLRDSRWELGDVVSALVTTVAVVVQLLLTAVLLIDVHPALLLLPLVGFVPLVASLARDKYMSAINDATAERLRLTLRLLDLSLDPRAAAELRLHGGADLLLLRHREAHVSRLAERERALLLERFIEVAGDVGFLVARLAAVAFIAVRAADGSVTVGEAVLGFALVGRVGAQIGQIEGTYDWLLHALRAVGRLVWLIDEAERAERAVVATVGGRAAPVPTRLSEGIRFDSISFTYPGTTLPVLDGVDLDLPAGSAVALVGDNGAGKTTLVKLLCRFYEPTAGRITVDGVDLRAFAVEDWRSRISAAFQEPAPFDLVAREVVGLGDLSRLDDIAAVESAIAYAGADSIVQGLPAGLDTPLGPSFVGGVELSGGQWQLLALARATIRARPLLLLLDEPTAALDPGREFHLFERYAETARAAARDTGGITLLVSHRFSTVRMADLIVVVDGGRIREIGSHDDLLGRNDLYAELYNIQARAYR